MNLILITGKARSGKDTSCEAIRAHFPKMSKVYSFATPLKRYLIDVMGLEERQCYGNDEDKKSETHIRWADLPFGNKELAQLYASLRHPNEPSPTLPHQFDPICMWLQQENIKMTAREVMQVFGSNICRRMHNNCFANATKKQIIQDNCDLAFVTDCRFPNEIEVFKDLNPIIVRLLRNPLDSSHSSEVALDDFGWGEYSNYIEIDNRDLSLEDKNSLVCNRIAPFLENVSCNS